MKPLLPREFVISHPLLTGWVWASLTIPLMMIFTYVAGLKIYHPNQVGDIVTMFIIGGPIFGYLLRWSLIRDNHRAR